MWSLVSSHNDIYELRNIRITVFFVNRNENDCAFIICVLQRRLAWKKGYGRRIYQVQKSSCQIGTRVLSTCIMCILVIRWYLIMHNQISFIIKWCGPLARYVKLRWAHAPGMPETFSPPPRVSDPDMHHGTCVTHMPWCKPGSLTSGFLWSR